MSQKCPSNTKIQQHQPVKHPIQPSKQGNFKTYQIKTTTQKVDDNLHGIFQTHEQKIQATYNFQSLFRKKSQIYNIHKNRKKLQNKNKNITSSVDQKGQKNVKKGHWTQEENKRYHWFLQLHHKHFIIKHLRRTDKIFKAMAAFIGTREAQQCRSHHQKMQKKYKNFYQIISKFRMDTYGSSDTENLRSDLLQGGYKNVAEKDSLLEEEALISNVQYKEEENDIPEIVLNGQFQSNRIHSLNLERQERQEEQSPNEIQEAEGNQKAMNLFLGQNYQNQFDFKLC